SGEWTGFYDWLRNPDRRLLGVRYWPFEATEFVIQRASNLPYVRTAERRYVEIFFGDERYSNTQLSKDQDFLYDPVYATPSGACALAFSTEDLLEADYEAIRAAKAEWVPI